MLKIGAKHTVHETRHTFRTWLDRFGGNITCINKLMGHSSGDVGMKVYTHKTIEELRETIELIRI
jgi:integrase